MDGVIVLRDEDIVIDPVPVDEGCQTPGEPIVVTVTYPYVTILSGVTRIGDFEIHSSTAMTRMGKSP